MRNNPKSWQAQFCYNKSGETCPIGETSNTGKLQNLHFLYSKQTHKEVDLSASGVVKFVNFSSEFGPPLGNDNGGSHVRGQTPEHDESEVEVEGEDEVANCNQDIGHCRQNCEEYIAQQRHYTVVASINHSKHFTRLST